MSNQLQTIVHAIESKLGSEIIVLDFRGKSPYFDAFIICSALNQRMANSICDHVLDEVEASGGGIRNIEGGSESRWILVDCYDVIVNIFVAEERAIYQLEKLWVDMPVIEVPYDLS